MKKPRKTAAPAPDPPASRATRLLFALVGVMAVLGGLAAWRLLAPAARGNGPIILVSVDTLRADRLPVYGYRGVRTPAIDSLAADGVLFERAYAHSPQTLPSHASILTGRLPFETGVRDNVGFTLPPGQPTLAELLRAHGLATAGVVSSFVLRKESGVGRGFDFYDDRLPPAAPDQPMGQVQRDGEASLQVAQGWMEGRHAPFFLLFHIYEPHTPYAPPARFAQYDPYDGEVAWSDEIVGRLFAWLKERGLYEDATIVFLSDHGEGLGDHGEQEHGLFLYDETIRVPLIIKLPGQEGAGRRVPAPVQHIDLVPTILDMAGAPEVSGLRGRRLRPVLESATGSLPEPGFYAEAFYSRYHFGWSELYSLTDARYRFIKAPRPELYDLQSDPRERRNLASERPQAVTAARAAVDRLLAGARPTEPARVSAEDLQRLQALGYIGTQVADPTAPGDALPDPKDKAGVLGQMQLAASLAGRRDFDAAIEKLQGVVAQDPGIKDAWLQLGVLLARAGRYGDSLDAFKRQVALDPNDANSFVSVAGVLVRLDRLAEAQANAEMALAKASGDARARTSACEVLAKIAFERRNDAAARRYALLAQEADPGFPLPAFVEGRILHRDRRFEEALARFQEAVRQVAGHPFTIPELHYYEGDTLANLAREEEAVAAFQRELRLSPGHLRTRASLAMLHRAAGRPGAAAREIAELLQAVPTREGYEMAAKTWAIFGETARADAVRAEGARRFGGRR
jgi:arylsulfatase A-like enzyme/tetratricopeptide (TPR) repeat protein